LHASDPLLAQVITLCEETVRACLLDGFIDSTWRESAQWVGDALPQSLALIAMAGDMRPLRRAIEMAAQAVYPDGMLPSVLPGEVHAYTVLDFNFVWVELLSLYWKSGHDPDFVAAMWPTLVKLLDRLREDMNSAGLLMSQPGRRLFLDWAPLSRNEPNAVYNLHYLLALRQAVQLAADRGAADQEAAWRARVAGLQAAIRAAFWHQERWYDDLERTTFSQLAAALALLAEATPPGHENGLLEDIAARSLDRDDEFEPGTMVLASPFMHHYVFEALRQGGKSEQVVEIVRRRWGRWVQAGYPTAWENWSVDFPDGSQCHAFSAHPRYHLAEIAREFGSL
jgi:alpha-L-rhamnosidase